MPDFTRRVESSQSLGELVREMKTSDPKILKTGIRCIKLNRGSEVYYPERDGLKIPLVMGDIVSFVLKRPLSTGIVFSDGMVG